jgi:hypothetical protein
MGNSLNTNPVVVDTTATAWSGTKYVRQAQWIDDAGDIAQNDILILEFNGATVTAWVGDIDNTESTTHFNIGPFEPPMPWSDLVVTVPHGIFVVWLG